MDISVEGKTHTPAVVIDGCELLVTSLLKQVVPPPMSSYKIILNAPCNAVGCVWSLSRNDLSLSLSRNDLSLSRNDFSVETTFLSKRALSRNSLPLETLKTLLSTLFLSRNSLEPQSRFFRITYSRASLTHEFLFCLRAFSFAASGYGSWVVFTTDYRIVTFGPTPADPETPPRMLSSYK